MATKKKYTAIAAALEWNEYEPQEDGLFLQPEEAEVINTIVADNAEKTKLLDEAIAAMANGTKTMDAQTETIAALQNTIIEKTNRITELEAEVATLGVQPSGKGTKLKADEDEPLEKSATPSYLSDDNPTNKWFDKRAKINRA